MVVTRSYNQVRELLELENWCQIQIWKWDQGVIDDLPRFLLTARVLLILEITASAQWVEILSGAKFSLHVLFFAVQNYEIHSPTYFFIFFVKIDLLLFLFFRDVGDGWAGRAIAHSGFGRSINPKSNRGGRLCLYYYLPNQRSVVSYVPVFAIVLVKIFIIL